jgi:hypothetical protein
MRLPADTRSFVAVCLAVVTAFGMSAVRTGAPRERERVVRMTRGSGQRLDFGEALLSGHEEASLLEEYSGEPASVGSRKLETPSPSPGEAPGREFRLRLPAVLPMASLSPTAALKPAQIPPAPGRAPPSI